MGQNRTDTYEQRAAKIDGAKRRQCPKCARKSAIQNLSDDAYFIHACRWCDYKKVTPKPGTWADPTTW